MNKEYLLNRELCCILGLPFDKVDIKQSCEIIKSHCATGTKLFISTPNLNFIINALSDKEFSRSVFCSELSVADGMPIIWIARLLGLELSERVAGSDLFEVLAKQDNPNKIKVFFFGGNPGIAEKAHNNLSSVAKGMRSAGWYDPGFISVEAMSSPEIINTINGSEVDFVVVALGAKKGQSWILRNNRKIHAPVMCHLGAVINFVAGSVERAPTTYQKLGLEWLWRIREEPTLWKRYFNDGIALIRAFFYNILPLYIHQKFQQRRKKTKPFSIGNCSSSDQSYSTEIELKGEMTENDEKRAKQIILDSVSPNSQVLLKIELLQSMTNGFLAFLVCCKEQARDDNCDIKFTKTNQSLMKWFRWNAVEKKLYD